MEQDLFIARWTASCKNLLQIDFWKKFPALYYGLYILLGAAFSLKPNAIYLFPLLFLMLTAGGYKKALVGVVVCFISCLHTHLRYTFPPVEKIEGSGIFQVSNIQLTSSPFQKSYLFTGTLTRFTSKEGKNWKNIPCRFYVPLHKERPSGAFPLKIEGTLIQKKALSYVVKPKKISMEGGNSLSLVETRFQFKEQFSKWLKKQGARSEATAFLLSMITGEIEERTMNLEFNRLGLQHILGVSGFQFVLLAACLGWLLRLFFSYKKGALITLILLTGYFFFLGDSPPAFRAWVAISLFLGGVLWGVRLNAVNALGAALLLELIKEPLTLTHIGFQLSYLCTFAILCLYPLLRKIFVSPRSFFQVLQLKKGERPAFLLSSFIYETIALNSAVHLLSLPLLLHLFGKFPVLSFFYNLFFPLGASLAFIAVLLSLPFLVIFPPLGSFLYMCTTAFTAALLKIAAHPPAYLGFYIRVNSFPLEAVVCLLTLGSLSLFYKTKNQHSLLLPFSLRQNKPPAT